MTARKKFGDFDDEVAAEQKGTDAAARQKAATDAAEQKTIDAKKAATEHGTVKTFTPDHVTSVERTAPLPHSRPPSPASDWDDRPAPLNVPKPTESKPIPAGTVENNAFRNLRTALAAVNAKVIALMEAVAEPSNPPPPTREQTITRLKEIQDLIARASTDTHGVAPPPTT